MKTQILLGVAAAALIGASCSKAEVTLRVAPDMGLDRVVVTSWTLNDEVNATRQNPPKMTTDTIPLVNNTCGLPMEYNEMACYRLTAPNAERTQLATYYAEPGDKLHIDIKAPGDYTVSGSVLMEGISEFNAMLRPIDLQYEQLMASGNASRETIMPLVDQYQQLARSYVAEHADSPAGVFAMLELEDQDFLDNFEKLSDAAKKTPFYPMVVKKSESVKAQMEHDRKQAEMMSGNVDAPAFTLNNLEGKPVSLSDFRGKWVVLDFWGVWCPWCIKGFPALKEAYAKYKDKGLEVIGVDNRDTLEKWKAGVEKYQLPWVNVYNPGNDESGVLAAYGVQGFPTKVIVNPEGKIVDITVGEDPEFFTKLDAFLNK